ncbi:hypothetical protein VFPPC_18015 [Pochonia chlamydosporia 170]|uniref:Uncharacterized protein n=1 Tax=Pochonia chlamydosporia 170 TaxID=1380566 RepID=A0A219APL3_METCM|nr:hypothetical protein VFPPC_18015 [Pochonia chlamydosporia 170]OWT42760.1 hypothetical protein VFPPC_18015 [Pochonia chlamydosporia 170]
MNDSQDEEDHHLPWNDIPRRWRFYTAACEPACPCTSSNESKKYMSYSLRAAPANCELPNGTVRLIEHSAYQLARDEPPLPYKAVKEHAPVQLGWRPHSKWNKYPLELMMTAQNTKIFGLLLTESTN